MVSSFNWGVGLGEPFEADGAFAPLSSETKSRPVRSKVLSRPAVHT